MIVYGVSSILMGAELTSAFPTSPSGKIKKNVLREMMAEKVQKEKEQRG